MVESRTSKEARVLFWMLVEIWIIHSWEEVQRCLFLFLPLLSGFVILDFDSWESCFVHFELSELLSGTFLKIPLAVKHSFRTGCFSQMARKVLDRHPRTGKTTLFEILLTLKTTATFLASNLVQDGRNLWVFSLSFGVLVQNYLLWVRLLKVALLWRALESMDGSSCLSNFQAQFGRVLGDRAYFLFFFDRRSLLIWIHWRDFHSNCWRFIRGSCLIAEIPRFPLLIFPFECVSFGDMVLGLAAAAQEIDHIFLETIYWEFLSKDRLVNLWFNRGV